MSEKQVKIFTGTPGKEMTRFNHNYLDIYLFYLTLFTEKWQYI